MGPGICSLCNTEGETVTHLFSQCDFFRSVWNYICRYFNLQEDWSCSKFSDCVFHWFLSHSNFVELPLFTIWEIWKVRNRFLFEPSIFLVSSLIIKSFKEYHKKNPGKKMRILRLPIYDDAMSMGYFDGAAKEGYCGAGMLLLVKSCHQIRLSMRAGGGTNMKAELLALWGLLWFALRQGIFNLCVFGDSKVVIEWAAGLVTLQARHPDHWTSRTRTLIDSFSFISFGHIFREVNSIADLLSKMVVGSMDGFLHFEEFREDLMVDSGSLYLF